MAYLRSDRQRMIDVAISKITSSFAEKLLKVRTERDATLLEVKLDRGKRYDCKGEHNADCKDDESPSAGEKITRRKSRL